MPEEKKKDEVQKSRFADTLEDIFSIVRTAVLSMWQSNVTIMASGLVYSTLVAIVPCITFLVAFLTVFGVLQPFMNALSALFEEIFGSVLGHQLMHFIEQFSANAMGLGVFGLVSFLITAGFLVNKVYNVLNQIFRAQPSSGKFRRFTSLLTFLIVGALGLAIVLSLNTTVLGLISNHLDAAASEGSILDEIVSWFFSFIVITLVLFLLFYLVPNAKIRARSAILGSLIGAVCLTVLGAVFKTIIARMVGYSVIYGSLAALLFVLLFFYTCWYIILISAEIIYVHQFRPEGSQLAGGPENPSRQITDTVNMMMLIGQSYKTGQGPVSRKNITRRLAITPSVLGGYISLLVRCHLLLEINEGKSASYVPAKPLEQILLKDIFDAVYGYDTGIEVTTAGEAVAEQIKLSCDESLSSLSLENLLERI